jgi:hypothetical protein
MLFVLIWSFFIGCCEKVVSKTARQLDVGSALPEKRKRLFFLQLRRRRYIDCCCYFNVVFPRGWRTSSSRASPTDLRTPLTPERHFILRLWIAPQNQRTQGDSCGGKDPTTTGIPDAAVEFAPNLNAVCRLTTEQRHGWGACCAAESCTCSCQYYYIESQSTDAIYLMGRVRTWDWRSQGSSDIYARRKRKSKAQVYKEKTAVGKYC